MLPIALCSIATIYLIGNGLLNTSKNRVAPPLDVRNLRHLFRSGDYEAAHKYCVQHPGAFTSVLQSGIEMLGDGKLATEEAMAGELGKQNAKIQTSLSYLSVIGVCTPMIGLLGTVTGMIKAFATLGSSGIGDPSSLSSAIGEVLVATASGLFIAIPAFGAFYFLRNRAGAAMHHVQDLIAAFFRKMPYDELTGARYGDGEIIAGSPQRNAEAQM